MKTSKTECARCGGGSYIGRYSHVASGVCFACGKAPVADRISEAQRRAESISTLAYCVDMARAGNLGRHVAPGHTVRDLAVSMVNAAPAYVALRACIAFGRLGVDLAE